jgi:hypothetical protein
VGDFLDGQQFVVGVWGVGHRGPLGVAYGVPPGGLRVAVREVGGCVLSPTKDCGQVPMVNSEEEASPVCTPLLLDSHPTEPNG